MARPSPSTAPAALIQRLASNSESEQHAALAAIHEEALRLLQQPPPAMKQWAAQLANLAIATPGALTALTRLLDAPVDFQMGAVELIYNMCSALPEVSKALVREPGLVETLVRQLSSRQHQGRAALAVKGLAVASSSRSSSCSPPPTTPPRPWPAPAPSTTWCLAATAAPRSRQLLARGAS